MVSYRESDVVAVVEATGEASRTGKIDALDKAWGVAVTFADGHRKWFAYDLWCPLQWEKGFSMVLTNDKPADAFISPPEEVGRGWLPRPPKRTRKMSTTTMLSKESNVVDAVAARPQHDDDAVQYEISADGCFASFPLADICVEINDDV